MDGDRNLNSHLRSPVVGSIARSAPHAGLSDARTRWPGAAGEPLARDVCRLPRDKGHAHLARVNEERARRRIETGLPEVGAASEIGTRHFTLLVRRVTREQHRTAIAPISFAHVVITNGLATISFAVGAIERVVEAVAIGEHHDLAGLAANRQVREDRHFGRIPVVHVVRRELVMPFQLAGVGIERDERIAIEVVALAAVAVVIGPGLPMP